MSTFLTLSTGSASDDYFTVFAGEGVRRVISLQILQREAPLFLSALIFRPMRR